MNPFLLVAIKLLIGFFAMVIIINLSGKGNLAPSSASDQIANYVLGGIIGGVIYNNSVKIPDFVAILCIWCILVLALKWVKRAVAEQNGQLIIIQAGEENPKFPIITDGQIQNDILKVIGRDEEWLLDELKKQGIEKSGEVFLGEYVDNSLTLTIYK